LTGPSTDSETPSNTQSSPVNSTSAPPANQESPAASLTNEPVDSAEASELKAEIEQNKTRLLQMKAELSDYESRLDELTSQIDADKATLQEMLRKNNLGEDVDGDLFEATKRRHNSAIVTYKQLYQEYEAYFDSYKSLANTTQTQINRYNALLRSQ
jgi:chromosome segregation ATPase